MVTNSKVDTKDLHTTSIPAKMFEKTFISFMYRPDLSDGEELKNIFYSLNIQQWMVVNAPMAVSIVQGTGMKMPLLVLQAGKSTFEHRSKTNCFD